MLRLFDTATGTVRPLEQRDPGHVSLYACGLTVYEVPHIGHGRGWLVFDVLRRYLTFRGFEVHHVSNVTDIDDQIIERAGREDRTESEVAAEFEAAWWNASESLGVLRPNDVPHATEYVEDMIVLIGDLIDRDVAYRTSTGVYLDVSKVPDYGLLGHQSMDERRAGARVDVDPEKRSPQDFALWKGAKPGEPTWDAPFGVGRPGWHTECVVMSLDLLGEGFDLHGGGQDLRFPHHENERAQAVAQGRPFARHWMHHGWVMAGSAKMSKSLGNFTTVADLLATSDPRAYRLLVLRSKYRSQIEVTPETSADAGKALERLDGLARRFELDGPLDLGVSPVPASAADGLDAEVLERFIATMDEDFDTPSALAGLFEAATRAHTLADSGNEAGAATIAHTVATLCGVLGLELSVGVGDELDDVTRALIAERDTARSAGDYARSDAIRDELVTQGWIVEDSPSGTTVRR